MPVNPSMRPVLAIGVIVMIVAGCVGVSEWRQRHATERIPWRDNLAAARAEAKSTGKPVFAYFTASWCAPCQEMKRTTWSDSSVEQAMRKYVPVKIDVDAHHDLAEKYGINPIPAFFILNDAGEPQRHTVGFASPEEMVAWLTR